MTLDRFLRRDKPNKETKTSANVCITARSSVPAEARTDLRTDQEKPIHDDKEPCRDVRQRLRQQSTARKFPLLFERTSFQSTNRPPDGGASRDRTDDLKLAKLALSQLSYGPVLAERVVGPGGFEPPTPRLSSVCSNQLSYRPFVAAGGKRNMGRLVRSRKGCEDGDGRL